MIQLDTITLMIQTYERLDQISYAVFTFIVWLVYVLSVIEFFSLVNA